MSSPVPSAQRRLARLCLRVEQPSTLARFYREILGMRDVMPGAARGSSEGRSSDSVTTAILGYDDDGCLLELRSDAHAPYRAHAHDLYWKMGITVRDLDTAVAYLETRDVAVSSPRQFRDIGYMSHLRDREGFAIELLQQGFEGDAKPPAAGHPIGAQATIAHITLRITDIEAAKRYCEQTLGLRLMSVQPVRDLGFCLYFYAFSDETLPDAKLEAIANRPWLWARPYALLELQHLETHVGRITQPVVTQAGFAGFAYAFGETLEYVRVSDLDVFR